MLWQLAYTEFSFTDVLWPDFDEQCMLNAMRNFSHVADALVVWKERTTLERKNFNGCSCISTYSFRLY